METNKFKCNVCNKYYKSYQSLWHHKKRYHDNIPTNIPQIPTFNPQIPTNKDINNMKKTANKKCIYCNKEYSSYNSMNRHVQICKFKENENEKTEMKKEIAELREMVSELIKNKSNIITND